MKVIGIVGSRRRNSTEDFDLVRSVFLSRYEVGDEIVSGGCLLGADHFAETIARIMQVPIHIYYAAWDRLGKGAGYARNGIVAREATILIAAVAPDRLGGTEDTILKFQKLHPIGEIFLV